MRQHVHHLVDQAWRPDVELCNECHPFFTGKQKLVDTGGRVERFNKRYGERKAQAEVARVTSAVAEARPGMAAVWSSRCDP